MRIVVVGNLPEDATEQGLREVLAAFAPVDNVRLINEADRLLAILELEITHAAAQVLALRIQGRIYGERALLAWVPRWSQH